MKFFALFLSLLLNISIFAESISIASIPVYLTYQIDDIHRNRIQNSDCPYEPQLWYKDPKIFIFNPKTLKWIACERGVEIARGNASGGRRDKCPDLGTYCRTPVGDFRVERKESESYKSKTFPLPSEDNEEGGGAPMPYAMFFSNGIAIHGSDYVKDYNASHGCIRVSPKDAKWLHEHFIDERTRVRVLPY